MRPPRLLLVSPIASHPADQGNAARIRALGAALMQAGVICEFLHVATEGETPSQAAAMAGFWHALHHHPAAPPPPPSLPGAWGLDDWCPPTLPQRVADLHRARRYDAVLVTYVWLSAALAGAAGAFRILDTHDLFGNRHEAAAGRGLLPSWFWTTLAEEARGLARADLVLAIQPAEAAALRARTATPVETLSHMPPLGFLGPRRAAGPRCPFGYLGSANPWNLAAIRALDSALAAEAAGQGPGGGALPWLIAGRILRRQDLVLASRPARMPRVAEAAAFYDAVDCVLNPMAGGTGLMVKTVEALAFGNPVLGTRDAFAGLPARHPGHQADSAAALVPLMRACLRDAGFRRGLALASRTLALEQAAAVAAQQAALVARLRALV